MASLPPTALHAVCVCVVKPNASLATTTLSSAQRQGKQDFFLVFADHRLNSLRCRCVSATCTTYNMINMHNNNMHMHMHMTCNMHMQCMSCQLSPQGVAHRVGGRVPAVECLA